MTARGISADAGDLGWIAELRGRLRAHVGLALLVLIYVLSAALVAAVFGDVTRISLGLYGTLFTSTTFCVALIPLSARAAYIMIVMRPRRLTRAIVDDFRQSFLLRRRVFNAAPVIVLLSIFSSVFTCMKEMIPLMHPYDWDATLMAVDRRLHFGVQPWALLQPVIGYPVVTALINVIYNSWFVVLIGCWLWQAFSGGDQRLRMQFFASFVLCFALLGNIAATCFASAGPCYFARLNAGPDDYAPLNDYLRRASEQVPAVWAVATQGMLWESYATNRLGIGVGISAMPSMHVSGATLFALLGRCANRRLGVALTAYLVIILIGSVHLAWHYAIDGYVSIVGTVVIWRVTGAVIDRFATADPSDRTAAA